MEQQDNSKFSFNSVKILNLELFCCSDQRSWIIIVVKLYPTDGVDRIGEINTFSQFRLLHLQMTLSEKGTMLCYILPRVHLEFNSNINEPLHRFYSVANIGFIT